MSKVLVSIPTYNESQNIEKTVNAVLNLNRDYDILIVDDNSPDGTGKIAQRLASQNRRVKVIIRRGSRGRGNASKEAYLFCLDKGYDYICEIDADLSHNPNDITRMVEMAAKGNYDIVAGSRYVKGASFGDYPVHRIVNSYVANFISRWILGIKIKDITQSFRLIKRNVLERLDFDKIISSGFSIVVETNYRAQRLGFKIGELPISITDRREGEAKFNIKEILKFIKVVMMLRFSK